MATGEGDFLEHIIHDIQSFMTGKEAARTTLLSKSWYKAWLTRRALDFNTIDFKYTPIQYSKFMIDTLQRYQDLDLKIHSFKLHLRYRLRDRFLVRSLVATAIKIGATDLDLNLKRLMLPPEVLASETLVRLSLKSCKINGNYLVRCSNLKSLSLDHIHFSGDDVLLLRNIISCCVSIEELSLSICNGLTLTQMDMLELGKLRRLSLCVDVDEMFFNDLGSRFPSLKYLNLQCRFNESVVIASPSLEHISFECWHSIAMFDVPNIRSFTYSVMNLEASLRIEESASTDWEFEICIRSFCFLQEATYSRVYLLKVRELLAQFRGRSRMSLCVSQGLPYDDGGMQDEEVRVGSEGVVLENLTIEDATSSFALLARVFRICRPKFLTTYGRTARNIFEQRDLFVEIGIKVEIAELYEQFRTGWRPLEPLEAGMSSVKSPKVRFQLTWEHTVPSLWFVLSFLAFLMKDSPSH